MTGEPHQPTSASSDAPGSLASYWVKLAFEHIVPGTLFALISYSQFYSVYGMVQGGPASSGPEGGAWGWIIAQRLMSATFYLLAAYLFTVRVPRRGARSGLLGVIVALSGTFCLTFIGLLPPADPAPERAIPSLILMIAGVGFGVFALLSLGKCFGIFPEARGLVTYGPYRYIRHPLYLAEIISSAGVIIAGLTVWSLVLFILFVLLQYGRAILEERALRQSIPEYTAYASRTWRILPGIH